MDDDLREEVKKQRQILIDLTITLENLIVAVKNGDHINHTQIAGVDGRLREIEKRVLKP